MESIELLRNILTALGGSGEGTAIENSPDLVMTYVYYDGGGANQRLNTITYHSATVYPLKKVVETYNWLGTPPAHYLNTITKLLEDV